MGIQTRELADAAMGPTVTLIRHAYTRTALQGRGVGRALLRALLQDLPAILEQAPDAAAKLESLRPSDVVQPELEELQSKLLQKVWANMDRDGNGVLDQGEMLGVLVVVQGADFEDEFDFEEVFEEVDADGSGSIEYEEFQSWFMGNYRERLVEIGQVDSGPLLPGTHRTSLRFRPPLQARRADRRRVALPPMSEGTR